MTLSRTIATCATLLASALLLVAGAGAADEEAVVDCARAKAPGLDGVRAVRVVEWDRSGSKHVATVRLYTRTEGGGREVLVRFTEPVDLRGNAFLMRESGAERELYFWSSELGGSKRISGPEKSLALFGRAFSYEDFEHLMASYRPGESAHAEETEFGNRRVSLVETHPADNTGSAYESVMTMFDLSTCAPLRLELYESGHALRKVISADPMKIKSDASGWAPNMVVLRDLEDFTTTLLMLDFSPQDPFPGDVPDFDEIRRQVGGR